MAPEAPARTPIPTSVPRRHPRPAGRQQKKTTGTARSTVIAVGTGRESARGGRDVIELAAGITVYPARSAGGRWRTVWHEAGQRQQCEAATQEKLAPKLPRRLGKVTGCTG